MSNVLYLLYDGLTDPLPQSQVIPYLSGLRKKGYTFTIISFDKPHLYEKNNVLINKLCKENELEWISLSYTKKPPILSTIYDLYRLYFLLKNLVLKKDYQIIHCRSYLVGIVGNIIAKKYSIKMIFDIRGFWPDEKIDSKSWNIQNPIFKLVYNYFKKKEKILFKDSDIIVSLTQAAKDDIILKNNQIVQEQKIKVIPCCVDTELFKLHTTDIEKTKKELGFTSNDFILSYLGSVGTWYELGNMFKFYNLLLQKIPTAKFLFITNSDKDYIINEAKNQNTKLNNLVIINSSRSEVPRYISCSNLSIFFYKNVYSAKGCSPTKQGELMSMGIPLLCNNNIGDTTSIINKYEAGITVSDYSESAMNNAIDTFLKTTFNKEKIRVGALEYYNLNNGIEKYAEIYQSLIEVK